MTPKDQVCEILYRAFLLIRDFAGDKKVCFALADILHNVPGQIARAIDGKMTYEEILADIRQRCRDQKCEPWLDVLLAGVYSRPPV